MSFTPFPHRYATTATASGPGTDEVASPGLAPLAAAAPAEFGGPGDEWSPETLLVASVAECFVLTFKSVARASSFPWTALTCEAEGTLDRVDRVTQFTQFDLRVALALPPDADADRAARLLEKAERLCLVTASLRADVRLDTSISVAADASDDGEAP